MERNDELYHYGVLGMKWGVHKAKQRAHKVDRAWERSQKEFDKHGMTKKWEKLVDKHAKLDKKYKEKYPTGGYVYRSHATKKYKRKAEKLINKVESNAKLSESQKEKMALKAAKFSRRALRSSELDKREQAYAERVSVGGNIAMRLLTAGNIGGKPYQQYLAMADAQGKGNLGAKFVAARHNKHNSTMSKNIFHPDTKVRDPLTARINSSLEKAAYLRTGEKEYMDDLRKKKKQQ